MISNIRKEPINFPPNLTDIKKPRSYNKKKDLGFFISVRLGGKLIGSFLIFDIICLIISSVVFRLLLSIAHSTLWSPVGSCMCCEWMLFSSGSSVMSTLGFLVLEFVQL